MKRRDAIKRTALMLGYAVSASSVATLMNGCKADPEVVANGLDNWTPVNMTKEQGQMIAHMAECILPKTDTPGAIEAGVHSYLDNALSNLADDDYKKGFTMWVKDISNKSQEALGKAFVDADNEERVKFLIDHEKLASESEDPVLSSWLLFKEQVLLAYFTSEQGQKEALVHLPIPGEYKGCIPKEEVGGVWAI